MYNTIQNDENRGFFCIDWTNDLEIYGDLSKDSSHLEFFLLPCNYLFTEWGYEGDSVHADCIWDLERQ